MKKVLSLLLAIVLVIGALPMAAFAAEQKSGKITFTTTFEEGMGIGDTFSVTATLSENPGIASFTNTLKWNDKVVEFSGFERKTTGNKKPITEVFADDSVVANDETGILAVALDYNNDVNGKLYTANFKIIAGGELGLGLATTEHGTAFTFADVNGTDIDPMIDVSALQGLTAAGAAAAPDMPEDAPFSAITTDAGTIQGIEDCGEVSVSVWGGGHAATLYHVVVPANATYADVTMNVAKSDLVAYTNGTIAGYVGQSDGDGTGVGFEEVSSDATTTTIRIPMVMEVTDDGMGGTGGTYSLVKNEDNDYYVAGPEYGGSFDAICYFSFEYGTASEPSEPEHTCVYDLKVVDTKYLKEDATCQHGYVYYKSCECGEFAETAATFENGSTVNHVYNAENKCQWCGAPEPNPITKIEVEHPNIKVTNVETNEMEMTIVGGVSEELELNIALESTELEASQEISWASSNSSVAWVEDGFLKTGIVTESTVVTLTAMAVDKAPDPAAMIDDEGSDALATLKVTVNSTGEGYTVNMDEDKTAVANETIQIPVTVTHTDSAVTGYKSYEFTFKYDPELLTLNNKSAESDAKDVTIEDNNGIVTVRRYGEELKVGEAAITLEFTAKTTCKTNVKLTAAKVGTSENARGENIPNAQIVDDITLITVTGYTVQLHKDFDGETVVAPGAEYTFEAKDKNYNYTVKATIGTEEIEVTDNGDGTFTIAEGVINGNVVIEVVSKEGKKFNVAITADADMAPAEDFTVGEDAAQYMVDYKAVLTRDEKFEYKVVITIGGSENVYNCNPDENGVYTIEGSAITGDINIEVTKEQVKFDPHDVEFTGTGAKDVVEGSAAEKAEHDKDYTFALMMAEGYEYTVTVDMGGEKVEAVKAEEANDDGSYTYTIAKVTKDLTIQIEKSNLVVEVTEYVKLNGKAVFLVTATQTLSEGKNLAYGEGTMFLKNFNVDGETVQQYAYLVMVESGTLTVEDATAQIKVVEAASTVLEDTFNVNESSALDINDAQLVYDLYNNVYQDIDTVGMQKLLRADVNGSKNINVQDAAAVVTAILDAQ